MSNIINIYGKSYSTSITKEDLRTVILNSAVYPIKNRG